MSNYRADTRDRLAGCGCTCNEPMPPFPAPVMPVSVFEEMMYRVAYAAGYLGSKTDFREDFADSLNSALGDNVPGLIIQKDSIKNFPSIGVENAIYIDIETREIYFWHDDGYYKIAGSGSGGSEGPVIPDNGLTYDGGVI